MTIDRECMASDNGTLDTKWPPSLEWQRLFSCQFDRRTTGLSLTMSAQKLYRGRLAMRLLYGDRNSQSFELDIQKQQTLWLPGDRVVVEGRLEDPIDHGRTPLEPGYLPNPTGALVIGCVAYAASNGGNRRICRSYSFTDPSPSETPWDIPIPRGAYAISSTIANFTGGNVPQSCNVRNLYAAVQANELIEPNPIVPLADYADKLLLGMNEEPLPMGANFLRVVPNENGDTQENIITLIFSLEP